MTINQKLKRQVRLGDSLLYSSTTPDCATALRSLIVTFAASPLSVTHRLRVVPFASLGALPVSPASLSPLQCLRQLSEMPRSSLAPPSRTIVELFSFSMTLTSISSEVPDPLLLPRASLRTSSTRQTALRSMLP
ncbi:hypothetical protein AB1Y20_016693 [Prymnesium parvum]|uniref:Uncharacterized protein n=1 Tax=Prymnesium parvum TaxID=97485 RepID=A0AB34IDE7_PRYPA